MKKKGKDMSKLIGNWKFYKRTLLIAVPVMIQNLITNFVALLDNIMVGQVGTEQMSGVAIVNQLLFVFNLTIFGAASGAGIFCAQFFGKKDNDGIRYTFRFKLISLVVITLIGILIFMFFGENLISMYLHDSQGGIDPVATLGYAKSYISVMLVGLLPFSLEQVYSSTLREGGMAMLPMIAGIVAVVTNMVFNYLLIFGVGPFPELGVVGAAIATVISRYVQLMIVVIWTHANSIKLKFIKGVYKTLKIPKELAKRIFTKGVLILTLNEGLWSLGVAVLMQCYSVRGLDVVAGLNISNTVVNLFAVLYLAFGSGVSVVIGQMLGANDLKGAKEAAPKLIFFAFMLCVAVGAVMAAFAKVFPAIYNTTDDVKNLATMFILISAFIMPVNSALHSTYFTLRSGGKTLITFIFDSGFSWLGSVPVAYCLAHFTNLDIFYVYLFTQFVEAVKLVVGIILINKGMWISNIVNE